MAVEVTPVQREIVRQVRALIGHGQRATFMVNGEAIRVHVKQGRRVRNTDITLDHGLDLYNIESHTFVGFGDVTTREFVGVYADQLGDIVMGAI